ncbi:MAG: PKD domain-containing protein, partial [Bacteroidales bacterium]|nr:PKD domain-containing protein [Bacteroidales bacterium]
MQQPSISILIIFKPQEEVKESGGRNRCMLNEKGVSEVIGAILLVSLVILGAMIVAVLFLSQPPPQEIPQVNAIAGNNTTHIFLLHDGGDPLTPLETIIRIDGGRDPGTIELLREDGTVEESPWTSGEWSVGKTLKVEDPYQPPQSVSLVYSGGSSQALLLTSTFVGTLPTAPTGTTTTSPTGTATTPTTTVTTTVTTSVTTTTTTTSPTPTPTPDCGTISGYKWNDLDGDGEWDPDEPGLSGWEIEAYECQTGNCNNPIFNTSAVTDSNGYYILIGLTSQPATWYKIQEVQQSGWEVTSPALGYYIEKIEPPGSPGQPGKCYETDINFGNKEIPPPQADFVANPTSGDAPLTVQFTDLSSGDPTQWAWNFGDGATSTEQNPEHTYNAPGTYTVSLAATNPGGSATIVRQDYISVISGPIYGNTIIFNKPAGGYLVDDTYIEFKIPQQGSPNFDINIYGYSIDLKKGDIVRLVINGNQNTGDADFKSTQITRFNFNVDVYVNGELKGSGYATNVECNPYESFTSTLAFHMPSIMADTQLTIDGVQIISSWPWTNDI